MTPYLFSIWCSYQIFENLSHISQKTFTKKEKIIWNIHSNCCYQISDSFQHCSDMRMPWTKQTPTPELGHSSWAPEQERRLSSGKRNCEQDSSSWEILSEAGPRGHEQPRWSTAWEAGCMVLPTPILTMSNIKLFSVQTKSCHWTCEHV